MADLRPADMETCKEDLTVFESSASSLFVDALQKFGVIDLTALIGGLSFGTVITCRRKCQTLFVLAHAYPLRVYKKMRAVSA